MNTVDITKEREWKTERQELDSKNKNTTRYVMKMLDSLIFLISSYGLPIKLKFEPDYERGDFDKFF